MSLRNCLRVVHLSNDQKPKEKSLTKKERIDQWGRELIIKWTGRDRKEANRLLSNLNINVDPLKIIN